MGDLVNHSSTGLLVPKILEYKLVVIDAEGKQVRGHIVPSSPNKYFVTTNMGPPSFGERSKEHHFGPNGIVAPHSANYPATHSLPTMYMGLGAYQARVVSTLDVDPLLGNLPA
jgi:hypothetical protein